ncbi:MAG: hypothetical protein K2H61_05725 [Muribaculaceae bacterium]|nr:hypothetical protein [Muribaculaceae bacterium]
MISTDLRLLGEARRAWNAGADLRSRRLRYKRFTYGNQWSDIIKTSSGEIMTERDHELRRGRRPMSNNLIRRLIKSIVGRFRVLEEDNPITDPMLARLSQLNNLEELDARNLEEFLISGCAIQKISAERRHHGAGVWVDNVAPDKFFINSITDPRGWDIELIGMLHDMSFTELIMRFASDNPALATRLSAIYQQPQRWGAVSPLASEPDDACFDRAPSGRCRVVEVWTLEVMPVTVAHDPVNATTAEINADTRNQIIKLNRQRRRKGEAEIKLTTKFSSLWRCRWLAPDGTLLAGSTASRHPFVVKLYPLIDGEVHSLVEDVIDQQIQINRLITLIDHIMGSSAKGALLFPVKQKVEGIEWDDISRMWSAPDAVIPYAGSTAVAEPHQVCSSGGDAIAKELLAVQLKMFEDVSGVSQALMGKTGGGGNVGIERYEAEVRNATITINDILKTFQHLRSQRNELMLNLSGKIGGIFTT